tara:strand:- start:19809 stop:22085 length:2277 start_codon:yes stop_codon:yes gene_type:complete
MVIYGNNLHEKLFGIAISKDYLKYNTPFCEFVEDPNLQVDLDIAINFNKAINGNTQAAYDVTELLTLSSGFIDWSTTNFYVDKMVNIPVVFSNVIDELYDRFANPANYASTNVDDTVGGIAGGVAGRSGFRDSFQDKLNTALADCLNSPCNIFSVTSDSIGRLSQPASTKTDRNTFGVGTLSGTFTNIINGLDQAVYNKIPAVFQNALTDITQLTQKAIGNTQAILAGKKNTDELINLAQNGSSMRDTSKMYRYTPDIKSYYDYSAAGSAILTQIKSKMGGCFDKFQHAYRYNPYEDNLSSPMTVQTHQYNGIQYETDPVGVFNNTTRGQERLRNATSQAPNKPKIISSGETFISESLALPKSNTGGGNYSVFAGFIDKDSKTFYVDNLNTAKTGNTDDDLTMSGVGCFGANIIKMCPSDFIKSADELNGLSRALAGDALIDAPYIVNKYSTGYSHDLRSEAFEQIQTGKIFNDGVAVSEKLWRYLTSSGFKAGNFYSLARSNQNFVAARVVGKTNNDWKLFKIVDCNLQSKYNVDFTPAAYKHLFGKINGYSIKKSTATNSILQASGWKALVPYHGDGNIEVKICTGDLNQIKEQLKIGETTNTGGSWEDWLVLGDSPTRSGGYGSMNSKLLDKLVEVAKTAGYKLTIISGYRSPAYNTKVGGVTVSDKSYKERTRHSAHTRRNAVDVTVSDKSYKERTRLIQIAIDKGIRGVGVYSSSLHFDIESKRAWGPSFSRTSLYRVAWAQEVLKNNGYAIS